MKTCPKGTDIDLCRNRDMYNDADDAYNNLYYEEKFCPTCEIIGPLTTPTSCFICNTELDDGNIPLDEVDEGFDKSKYHINCYYFSIAKIAPDDKNEQLETGRSLG